MLISYEDIFVNKVIQESLIDIDEEGRNPLLLYIQLKFQCIQSAHFKVTIFHFSFYIGGTGAGATSVMGSFFRSLPK